MADEFNTLENDNAAENVNLCCPSTLSCIGATLCFPLVACNFIKQVEEKQEFVVLNFGTYSGRLREPGLQCVNPCGITLLPVSTKQQIINIDTAKVLDKRGSPIVVSGIVSYFVIDSRKAALNVENSYSYISNQALAVMKSVCARYPYEARSNENEDEVVSLRGDTDEVRAVMVEELQRKVGQTIEILIDSVEDEGAIGRSMADAPEIDGKVYLDGVQGLQPGDFVEAEVTAASEYDLWVG